MADLSRFTFFSAPFSFPAAYTVISIFARTLDMELTFSDLRRKEVINTQDGRRLGRACDVLLCSPENRWLGIVVPGDNGFFHRKNDLFIDFRQVVKVGEDVILVNVGLPCHEARGRKCGRTCPPNRQGENNPPYPSFNGSTAQTGGYGMQDRRNFEEME